MSLQNLHDLPHQLKQKVVLNMDLPARLTTRNYCPIFRQIIDTFPINFTEILFLQTDLPTGPSLAIRWNCQDGKSTVLGYAECKTPPGAVVEMVHRKDMVVVEHKKRFLAGKDFMADAMKDVKVILGNPKVTVDQLVIKNALDSLKDVLSSLTPKLSVRHLVLHYNLTEASVLAILPYLKPRFLHTIHLWNDTESIFLDEVVKTEQWKGLKSLYMDNVEMMIDDLVHFDHIHIKFLALQAAKNIVGHAVEVAHVNFRFAVHFDRCEGSIRGYVDSLEDAPLPHLAHHHKKIDILGTVNCVHVLAKKGYFGVRKLRVVSDDS